MKKILEYVNPFRHLGEGDYSFFFPAFANILLCLFSELFVTFIAKNPDLVGVYIIFFNVAFIIYFSFREGIRGGFISAIISVLYYFYIIFSRNYTGSQLRSSIEIVLILTFLYLFLGWTIGWLREHIDKLIEKESDSRRRLESIIEQLPMGILITDSTGRLIQRNKKLDQILGFSLPIGFQIGKDTLNKELINDEPIKPSESPLANALSTGKPVVGKEFMFQRKDKKKINIQVSSAPIQNAEGKIIAAASIINDITRQKELEKQKDEFLSMASHELKTPITSLKMFVDLTKNQIDKKDLKKINYYNSRIIDQVERLRELTNDLLDVSRIQIGKIKLNREIFYLDEIIKNSVNDLQATTDNHKIIYRNKEKILVIADKYRIYQVLVNLISNAIKYSPNKKKIYVSLEKRKKIVIVNIKDSGLGIERNQQKKIFDKMYQVNNPKEKTFPGLGLGLYISKEIIERHNGKIWVNSEIGKGSNFYFSLPLNNK